jgi:hypothetical protein
VLYQIEVAATVLLALVACAGAPPAPARPPPVEVVTATCPAACVALP